LARLIEITNAAWIPERRQADGLLRLEHRPASLNNLHNQGKSPGKKFPLAATTCAARFIYIEQSSPSGGTLIAQYSARLAPYHLVRIISNFREGAQRLISDQSTDL